MKRLSLGILILSLIVTLTGCGSMYEGSKSNFTSVTTVKAASFEVPSGFISKATAISSISNSEEYDGIYVYKDGATKYVLFDTTSVVIACGPTSFNFAENETEETLESKSVEGIWSVSEKKLNYDSETKDGTYKIICRDLLSQFSITQTQYCDLKGSMATCSDGNVEYSIYAGAVVSDSSQELTKEQSKIIEHIVRNFALTGDNSAAIEESENTEDAEEDKEQAKVASEVTEELAPEDATESSEVVSEESEAVENTENSDDVEIIIDESVDSSTEDTEGTGQTEQEQSADAESAETSNNEADEDTSSKDAETSEETANTDDSENANTEEETSEATAEVPVITPELQDIDAKVSTVYNPLNIGEWGIASAISADNEDINVSVKLDNIYTGEEAMNIIKANGGRKLEPLIGTSFVVAEYTSTVPVAKAYMDVRFTGVDGSRLVQRGISYTTRTYDIDGTEQLGSGYNLVTYEHRYVYYEVPTGCKEYMLVFGVHMAGVEDIPTANYFITKK